MKKFMCAFALAVSWCCSARADFTITWQTNPVTLTPGATVTVSGTLTNTDALPVYLNADDTVTTEEDLVVDDLPFVSGAPDVLQPGASWTGPMLTLTAGPLMSAGTSTATITVIGGANEDGATDLAELALDVRVTPLYGDVNGDGIVSFADVVQAMQVAGGLSSQAKFDAADVAPKAPDGTIGDFVLDIQDAVRIARRLAGLEAAWP
ncbi:MAG TPA: hypothetical protein VGM37_15185 [Armatimonadota bacterium]|jgi:hypothetical protein